MTKFGKPAPEIEGLIAATGLRTFHSFEQLHVDDVINMLVELLEISTINARAKTIQCHNSYVRLS
ncbi:hypothetical protein GmHk_14G042231 [Glycine max]|nr:hypothetical protein GmHk_14G042231 [Glycine max]